MLFPAVQNMMQSTLYTPVNDLPCVPISLEKYTTSPKWIKMRGKSQYTDDKVQLDNIGSLLPDNRYVSDSWRVWQELYTANVFLHDSAPMQNIYSN